MHSNGSFESVFNILHDNEVKTINYIRSTNVGDFFINGEIDKISLSAHNKLVKTKTIEGDILTARTGKVGGASIITKDFEGSNSNQNVVNIRVREKSIVPLFLVTFLNCKYGLNQFIQASTGNVQPWLNLSLLRKVKIPTLCNNFQLKIEKLVDLAYLKLEKSKIIYKQSEELLLKELDLLDFEPSKEKIAIKTFSESFGDSGRLDSEYYQPKYDEIIDKIKSYQGGFTNLNDILVFICTGEYSEEYYKKSEDLSFYIRSTNINNGLVQKDENHYVNKNNFTRFAKEGDIVTARVGTLGIFGTIDKNQNNSIYSDNVLCFRLPDNLNPYVYTLFLNSKYNKLLIDRLARGSVQQRLNQETLKDLFIPIIDNQIQTQIEVKIKESFKLKEESKQLLEVAKRAVEIAIEEGEDKATKYIKDNKNG